MNYSFLFFTRIVIVTSIIIIITILFEDFVFLIIPIFTLLTIIWLLIGFAFIGFLWFHRPLFFLVGYVLLCFPHLLFFVLLFIRIIQLIVLVYWSNFFITHPHYIQFLNLNLLIHYIWKKSCGFLLGNLKLCSKRWKLRIWG